MCTKRTIAILACVTFVVFALSCFFISKSKPSISMGLVQYVDRSNSWFPAAIVGFTNNGAIMVRYDHVDSDEPSLLRTESRTGWVSEIFHPVGGITIPPQLLKPGSNVLLLVPLRQGTLRWQLRYTIRRASSRDRVGSKLTGDFGDRLYRLCGHLLSTNDGPPQEFWSEVFEIPSGMGAPSQNRDKLGSNAPSHEP